MPTRNHFNPCEIYTFSCWPGHSGHTSTRYTRYCPYGDGRLEDCGRAGYTEEEEEHGDRQELGERDARQTPDDKECWMGKELPAIVTQQHHYHKDMGRYH
jgi:hypothetical protein